MTWLRLFNPVRHHRLEREHARLATSAGGLAESVRRMTASTLHRQRLEEATIRDALTTFDGVCTTLKVVAADMECGRINDAHILVDALIVTLKDASR